MSRANPMSTLKRLVLGGGAHRVEDSVNIGDRFEELDHGLPVWVVERISSVSGSRFPLVSLRREGVPDLERTLSLAALEDAEAYRRTMA